MRSCLRLAEAGMLHKLRQPLRSCTRAAAINSPIKDMAELAEHKNPNPETRASCGCVWHASHASSQQCVIPVQIAFVRHALAEACDINIVLDAQRIEYIIWKRSCITQVEVALQNLR